MEAAAAVAKTKGRLLTAAMAPVVAGKEIQVALARLVALMEMLAVMALAALNIAVAAAGVLVRQEPRHQIHKSETVATEPHRPYLAQALLTLAVVAALKAIQLLAALEARAAGAVLVKMRGLQTLAVAVAAAMEAVVLAAQAAPVS
jgi:hypothetical protein